ncbi:UDP-glucuronosyl/UDP-glucosyltransferase family-containing protein [Aphelenchoides besseyi]|nr:UDP-glucuronosyl/UDP-glucosyltransferase family-containing protein [Aphelenchoides besseyi]
MKKFDIAMSEIMDPCGFMLMRKAGIKKSIALHASYLPIHWQTNFGLPASVSFVPDMQTTAIPPFSFVERVKAQLFYWFGHFVIYGIFRDSYAQLEYLVEDNYNVESSRINNETVDFSIAGIDMAYTLKNRKGLDKVICFFQANQTSHCSITTVFLRTQLKELFWFLLDLWRVVARCPMRRKQSFLEMFAAFPEIDFIWKYEVEDGIGSALKNLMIEKWIPQPDLLCWYKENAQKLAEILAAKTSPDERLVKSTEFAARFDVHEHLDLPGRHLSVVEYYNLDVLAFVSISVSLFIFTAYKLLRVTFYLCLWRAQKSKRLSEFFDPCGFGIMKKIGLTNTVGMMTTTLPPIAIGMLGIPSMSSFVPDMTMPLIPPFGFIGRLKIQLINIIGKYVSFNYLLSHVQDAFDAHNLNITIDNVFADSSLFLINNDEYVDDLRSYKMIPIAGVGLAKNLANPKKLETNLQKAFDSSVKGVVYISFGSVANAYKMPAKTKQAFLDAVRAFPDITFLFKYERDDLTEGKPKNLILSKWFSQPDILAQPKLLAFVTHAGKLPSQRHYHISRRQFNDRSTFLGSSSSGNSTGEMIYEIEPRPSFAELESSYKQNAIDLAKMVRDKPMNADERVLKYLAFAAKYEDVAKNMDLPGRYMSTIEFYNIDVFAFLFTAFILTLLTIVFSVRIAIRLCLKNNQKNKTE